VSLLMIKLVEIGYHMPQGAFEFQKGWLDFL